MISGSLEQAQALDAADECTTLAELFHFPVIDGERSVYLCGNSLGLQPKRTREKVIGELDAWAEFGVEGHFARTQWFAYHEPLLAPMARVVGAEPDEIAIMGSLTANLHALMVSFYTPTAKKRRILCEANAFPSDLYALEAQSALHGLDPKETLLLVEADRDGLLSDDQICDLIRTHRAELAMVMLGGVNYLTGQVLDMQRIASVARQCDVVVGFDLAHAVGNVELSLSEWGVDFAAWCTYKYLNAGPGSVGGLFVHRKHCARQDLKRLAGWWGNDPASRFEMARTFTPAKNAGSWQMSNAPVLSMACLAASLEVFDEVGIATLAAKSRRLSAYLRGLLEEVQGVAIVTPSTSGAYGAQFSLRTTGDAKQMHTSLSDAGVVCDFREPDVIRVALAPLYNTFTDAYRFASILNKAAGNEHE